MTLDWLLLFAFAEEEEHVRRAILDCSLTGGNKEAFEDEFESEEDEED